MRTFCLATLGWGLRDVRHPESGCFSADADCVDDLILNSLSVDWRSPGWEGPGALVVNTLLDTSAWVSIRIVTKYANSLVLA
jgi:hypothetical protein